MHQGALEKLVVASLPKKCPLFLNLRYTVPFCNMLVFCGWQGIFRPQSKLLAGVLPLSAAYVCLFITFALSAISGGWILHLQPDIIPCHVHKRPVNVLVITYSTYLGSLNYFHPT